MRNRIMAAAMDEMNKRGVKFTMSDLAGCLAVSKSTLYEYFNSKEELIGAVMDGFLAEHRLHMEMASHDDTLNFRQKLISMMTAHPKVFGVANGRILYDIKHYLPAEWKKFECFIDETWKQIEKLISEGIEKGGIRPINLAVFRKVFMGGINELVNFEFLRENNLTIFNAIEIMADILFSGLVIQTKTES